MDATWLRLGLVLTTPRADARWLTLTNALSGLFCASLNFIDSTRTIRPVNTFEPEGVHKSIDNLQLLHGTLPHEVVCTENLTPFLKLLPCKGKAGISSLLDGHKLFDATWQTMAIDVRPICPPDGGDCMLEMQQVVAIVLDLDRSKRPRDNPIPRPPPIEQIECDKSKPYGSFEDHCYPLEDNSEPGWSLKEIFGRPITRSCPLGTDANSVLDNDPIIWLDVPSERSAALISIDRTDPHPAIRGVDSRAYALSSNSIDFDLILPKQQIPNPSRWPDPPLYAERSITGYGQERGGIQTLLTNPHDQALSIVYLESLPWYMKPYLHTLKASTVSADGNELITETYYRPGLDRHRPTHLEVTLSLPPHSTITLTYMFQKSLLRYTEYPPDANRGFDVPSAVIRILSKNNSYVRTTPLLLGLPTPDFSMPYNVIILTSTVMALGFGGVFNVIVRRMVGWDEVPPSAVQLLVERVKRRFGGRIRDILRKYGRKGNEKKE